MYYSEFNSFTFIVSLHILHFLCLSWLWFTLKASLHRSWLYANLHNIIAHTTFPLLVLIVVYLEGFPSPIVIVCQPSSYHFTNFSFAGLDCGLPWRLSFANCDCTVFPSYSSWLCITLKCFPYLENMNTIPSSILIAFKLSSPIVIVLPTFVISLHILALAS